MAADTTLRQTALRQLAGFFVGLAVLIQLPAWTVTYWEGWIYWAIFAGACLWITLYFLDKAPDLIARRMSAGPAAETEPAQKLIEGVLAVVFVLLFVVAGLDHHFGWSHVPTLLVILGEIGVALGFAIIFATFDANRFAASTVTVDSGQTVIGTGPYAIVRHPMYAGATLMVIASPFALGSLAALAPAGVLIVGVCWRLMEEEAFLIVHLPGYVAYREKTATRLIPYIW